MQEINIPELTRKFKAGQCTPQEIEQLENWYLQWKPTSIDLDAERMERHMAEVWQQMPIHAPAVQRRLWPRYAAAIAIFLTLGVGLFHFTQQNISKSIYVNDVQPGHSGATLKLANGKVIELDGNKKGVVITASSMKYADGSQISREETQPNQLLIAATSKGQTYAFTLPDGTRVWLNAETELTFPAEFDKNSRSVNLKGEAYFEVAKDKEHPFLLKSIDQELTVLGTHFNVTAYPEDKRITTTLLEGSVKITSNKGKNLVLAPGQQSNLNGQNLQMQEVDTEEAIAWKNGYFRFNDLNIKEVMHKLSRWYNIEVLYEGGITEEGFNGTISRSTTINDVLKMLEKTKTVHFKVEGRRVTVMQ